MSILSRGWLVPFPQLREPWAPAVDVYRARNGWILKFDLAGVQVQDVTVTVSGRRVSVQGVRRDSIVEEGCSYYVMEISYDRFERTLEMPSNLDGARVSVETQDGILLVRVITEGNQNG